MNNDDKLLLIEIFKNGDGIILGKILKNEKNPAEVGKIILENVIVKSGTSEFQGSMLVPEGGLKLDAVLSCADGGTIKLEVSKYFISKTLILSKVL